MNMKLSGRCKHKLLMVSTGGTIDKAYNEADGRLENRISLIRKNMHQFLRLPSTEIDWMTLMHKDSLAMDTVDRDVIASCIHKNVPKYSGIVVLHGTDTVDLTVEQTSQRFPLPYEIPVVFTGAMKPYGFFDSDAVQNVTEAVLAAKFLPGGLYLSFHSQIFEAGRFKKNRVKKTFEYLS
ncbi:MAG: asparaginase domain-containing protein [Zetaproteobacteria bacterium]|nr:asparaginase domain-containing protein [Zetaproteobacteria bacterium]